MSANIEQLRIQEYVRDISTIHPRILNKNNMTKNNKIYLK